MRYDPEIAAFLTEPMPPSRARALRPRPGLRRAFFAVLLAAHCGAIQAQVSANEALDACMRDAAVSGAVTGGGVGGLLGSLLGNRSRDQINRVLGGAAAGAAVGAIAAWQLAYKSCSARFATASSLITSDYAECAKRIGYDRQGVLVEIEGAAVPDSVRGGERLSADVRYHVLTPDPKDVPLQLTRRFLCRDEEGRFNEISSPSERITVSSGCHVSRGSLLMPGRIPAEQDCRMEVTLQAEGQTRNRTHDFRILP